jgi:2',3'-cyclic-nucleotide 2'-phosphodiesterase (5'-nucleotidase family)
MFLKLRIYLFALPFLFLGACSHSYHLVKSNREGYKINSNVAVDSAIIKTYLPYKVQMDAEMSKVIGWTDVALTKSSTVPESVLGNFFADAVMHQAKMIAPNIDFSIGTTKGGLRNDIAKGPITVSDIFELMPFENQLVLFELNGADALNLIKFIAATNGQPVAGLKMNIKDKLPENILINGKPFDVNKTYMVVASDYIASGGDDAQGFTNPISRKNLDLLVRTALLKEVEEMQQAGKKINAKLDGRITKN